MQHCIGGGRRHDFEWKHLAVWTLIVLAAPGVSAQPPIAITDVAVLTMTDGPAYQRDQTVVIRDSRILAIGRSIAIPPNAQRIDGRGKVLMPGLMDMHVHLGSQPENWIGAFLGHGITTVLNLRGGPDHLVLRGRIARRELLGPRVYTSGSFVNRPAIETEADALRALREQQRAGYDVLKIHGNLGAGPYRVLMDSARALRMPVVGHAPRNLPFDSLIAVRQPMVVHAEELIYTKFTTLDTAAIGDVPARMAAAGIWLTPTLSTFRGIATQWSRPTAADSALAQEEVAYFDADLRRRWREDNPYTGRAVDGIAWVSRAYAFQLPLVRALHRAGVRLLVGTDTPVPIMAPGASVHLELEELRRAGLSPYDALEAATSNPGEFVRMLVDTSARIGRVHVGYTADLLLLDGDPLTDPSTLRRPRAVLVGGRMLGEARLAELRQRAR